jgi:nitrile hydratase alpha subunit
MTPQEQNIVANLVVQSMTDEAVRNNLLSNPTGTLTAAGVNLGPQPPTIVTVADTSTLFNVIVPLTPLGPAQQLLTLPLPSPTPFCIMVWIITNIQQNTPLAASLIADPLSVLRGMGVKYLPAGTQIKVWQETQTTRYLGLPYYGATSAVPPQLHIQSITGKKHHTPPPVNVNVNVNVNANVEVNAVAVVNAAAVANVEAALQVSSALVAAEVIAVLVI